MPDLARTEMNDGLSKNGADTVDRCRYVAASTHRASYLFALIYCRPSLSKKLSPRHLYLLLSVTISVRASVRPCIRVRL